MSHSNGNQSTPPGWHADPSGAPGQRWWDGTRWTEHTQATPPQPGQHQSAQHQPAQPQPAQPQHPQAPQPPYGQQPGYSQGGYAQQPAYGSAPAGLYAPQTPPPVAPGTPVYNAFIWLVTLMPVVSLLILPLYSGSIQQSMTSTYRYGTTMSASLFGVQAIGSLISLVLYAAIVVLSYFDHKWLLRHGYVQPFHWAWAFLSIVYPIGRSVVVRRRSGRGIAPMWVSIGLCALSIVVTIVWTVSLIASAFGAAATYGSYT